MISIWPVWPPLALDQPLQGRGSLLNRKALAPFRAMASEIFGTAALFWVLIPVGLAGGALLLKLLKD